MNLLSWLKLCGSYLLLLNCCKSWQLKTSIYLAPGLAGPRADSGNGCLCSFHLLSCEDCSCGQLEEAEDGPLRSGRLVAIGWGAVLVTGPRGPLSSAGQPGVLDMAFTGDVQERANPNCTNTSQTCGCITFLGSLWPKQVTWPTHIQGADKSTTAGNGGKDSGHVCHSQQLVPTVSFVQIGFLALLGIKCQ